MFAAIATAAIAFTACGRRQGPVRAAYSPLAEVEATYGPLITAGNHPTPDQHGTGERVAFPGLERHGLGFAAYRGEQRLSTRLRGRRRFTKGRLQTPFPRAQLSLVLLTRPQAGAVVPEVWSSCCETHTDLSRGRLSVALRSLLGRRVGRLSRPGCRSNCITAGWRRGQAISISGCVAMPEWEEFHV